ncbi:MAG: EamA family transporter [Tannerella sp.]|jgi:undecaprenyl phosphate-alpha-L-ara4N flippase subunit ArnE|nr:EamA family transporter [Tannerella sp.]
MLKLLFYSTLQSLCLVSGQIFLKVALAQIGKFSLSRQFVREALTTWQLAASGLCMALASLLWFHILKHYAFSVAYPMISISYIFGLLAAVFVFHESIPLTRWIGVFLIMGGVVLVAKGNL